jgi:hypothetical protein
LVTGSAVQVWAIPPAEYVLFWIWELSPLIDPLVQRQSPSPPFQQMEMLVQPLTPLDACAADAFPLRHLRGTLPSGRESGWPTITTVRDKTARLKVALRKRPRPGTSYRQFSAAKLPVCHVNGGSATDVKHG